MVVDQTDPAQKCVAIVERANTLAAALINRSESNRRSSARTLIARAARGWGSDKDSAIAEALALYAESSRRVTGRMVTDDQVFAAAAMCIGVVPELSGSADGSAGMAAYWYSLPGRGVHVLCADEFLAQRDLQSYSGVLTALRRSVAVRSEVMSEPERRAAYRSDITISGYMGFMDDFLQDNLPYTDRQPIQRGRYAAVVGDGSSVGLGQAGVRRAVLAPRDDVAHVVRSRRRLDHDRALARVLQEGGAESSYGAVRLNGAGIAAIADELGLREFSPEFVVAAEDIRSQLESSGGEDEIPYVSIALFAYLGKYQRLALALWSVSEDAPDLLQIYGRSSVRLREADAVRPPGLPVMFADPMQRLEALRDRVEVARSRGLPVMIHLARDADADACSAMLTAGGITSALVRAGDELRSFNQAQASAATIVGPGVTMPDGLDHTAGGAVYVALGADHATAFVDWTRKTSRTAVESWVLVGEGDTLLRGLDPDVLGTLHRLPGSFDDPDGQRAVAGAALYRSALTRAHEDRLLDWAFRSSVEKNLEQFYELRGLVSAAPADELVRRTIDEYVTDATEDADPQAVLDAVCSGIHISADDDPRVPLTEVYDAIRQRSDPAVLSPLVRDTMAWGVGDAWCRFNSAASFIRRHLFEAYPPGSNKLAEYRLDLSRRSSQCLRDFRRDALRSILSAGLAGGQQKKNV